MATWNVEWFGDAGNGPRNDLLQWVCVRSVIGAADLDLWSVQEIVDRADFETLLDSLPGYEGLLANSSQVESGPQYYNDFSGMEQKVALVWKSGVLSVTRARIVLTNQDFERLGYNLGQIISTGQITARDLRDLRMVGLDLADVFRQTLGKSIEEVNELLKTGGLTMEDVSRAVSEYADKNFGGAAERLAKTFSGLKSSIKDLFFFAGSDINFTRGN